MRGAGGGGAVGSRGISGAPAVVVEEKVLISGGQPAEVFEEVLRRVAGEF